MSSRRSEIILVLLAGLALAALYAPYSYDEAFITFRYGRNLAEGRGLVFNPGEDYLGTTGPGWAMLLGGLHRLVPFVSIAGWGSFLSGVVLIGLGLSVYGLALSLQARPAWLPGVLVMAHPLVIKPVGGEVLPQLLLMTLAWWCVVRQHHWGWGILAGLATWVRSDGIIALPVLAVAAYRWHGRLPWRGLAGYGAALLPWLVFSTWQYGQPWPSTISAKTAQCISGRWRCFGPGLVQWLGGGVVYQTGQLLALFNARRLAPFVAGSGGLAFVCLLAAGAYFALRRERRWGIILLWPLLHLLAYVLIRAPFYRWYASVPGWGFALVASLGVLGWLHRERGDRLQSIAALVLALVTLGGYGVWHAQHYLRDVPDPRQNVQYRLAEWFEEHVPAEAEITIMAEEIGFLGYYLPRHRIYETWGLITPGAADRLMDGELDWVVRHYCPDFFLAYPEREQGFRMIPGQSWFRSVYRIVGVLEDTGLPYAPRVTMYEAQKPCPASSP